MPEQDLFQPKVFCQKGKCYPYDPARMKNPNINMEMKPGAGNLSLLNILSCFQIFVASCVAAHTNLG